MRHKRTACHVRAVATQRRDVTKPLSCEPQRGWGDGEVDNVDDVAGDGEEALGGGVANEDFDGRAIGERQLVG